MTTPEFLLLALALVAMTLVVARLVVRLPPACIDDLSLVELAMEIEETFGVTVRDDDAERLRTVGELYDHVWKQLSRRMAAVCMTRHCFYRLREEFERNLSALGARIMPSTPIDRLLPATGRRRAWRQLARVLPFALPAFRASDTFGQLAEKTAALNHERLQRQWREGECWQCVRQIVAAQLEVDPQRVTRNAGFFELLAR